LLEHDVDVVVLGCTHYIFIRKIVESFFSNKITIIETGDAVALQVQRKLKEFNFEGDMLDSKHIIYSNSKYSKMNLVINSLLECYDLNYDFRSNWDEGL
jgi:glutamate racemase